MSNPYLTPPQEPQEHQEYSPYAQAPPQYNASQYSQHPFSQDPNTVTENSRLTAIAAHILGFFIGGIVPLIIFLVKKDDWLAERTRNAEVVYEHVRMSANVFLTVIVSVIVGVLLMYSGNGGFFLGTLILFGGIGISFALMIGNSVKAAAGQNPVSFPVIPFFSRKYAR